MPVKTDETGKHWVEMQWLTPGTPEQVWQAMATGAGYAAWFTRAEIDGRVGGALRFDFGPNGSSTGEVTAWEPPHHFAYVERDWSKDAPPVSTEITITSRPGGHCVVRMVHSLFTSTSEWDDQLEGFESGWPAFFEVLRLYLSHFADKPSASFGALTTVEGNQLDVWTTITKKLGLAGANSGERRQCDSPEHVEGIVERVHQDAKQRFVIVRLDTPGPGVMVVGTYGAGTGVNVSVSVFCYGDDAVSRAAVREQIWRGWLSEGMTAAQES